jgi:phage tail sheath gpL-like
MPENISFNQIPVDIRTPGQYIEIDNSKAVQGLPGMERRILVMGQRFTAGTVAQGVPVRVLNADQAELYFGRGSMLHTMVRAAKEANGISDMWAVALNENAAGVVATGTLTFTGAVTEAGTLHLYIGGQAVKIAVAASEPNNTTATNVAAAINAQTDLPVTAAAVTNVVTLTCRWKGLTGNDIDVRVNYYMGELLPKGAVVAIVAMASGTANPDVNTALSAITDDQYYTIINPWTDAANMAIFESEMNDRWGPMEQKTGHGFSGYRGTHGAMTTYGSARNSVHSSVIGAFNSPTPPWIWGAVWGATCEYYGAIDPARPFQTLQLKGLLAPPEEFRFTRAERDLLLRDGISTFLTGPDGSIYIERVITTYQTNVFGVQDISYLDLETKWTVDYIRYAVRARIALRFPRYKLANDGTQYAPGQAIVTPKTIRAELLALFKELEYVGLVESFDQFKADLLVVRSQQDPNRVNAVIPPDVINQFRIFAAAVQFRL